MAKNNPKPKAVLCRKDKNLLGHTPGTIATSSIAILPKLFLPTVPSNTIYKRKTISIKNNITLHTKTLYVNLRLVE